MLDCFASCSYEKVPSGAMQTGEATIDGIPSAFTASGMLIIE